MGYELQRLPNLGAIRRPTQADPRSFRWGIPRVNASLATMPMPLARICPTNAERVHDGGSESQR
jgi:hypothetical protein